MASLSKKIVCSVSSVIAIIAGGVGVGSIGDVDINDEVIGSLRVSTASLEIMGNAEGCRQDVYMCPAGLATNGIGNTHNIKDDVVSLDKIAADWVSNIIDSERCVTRAESMSGEKMTQGQFDAFVSFSFNTGCTRFMKNSDGSETGIYRHIKNGDYIKACHELPRWVYGGGVKLNGLVTRRQNELELCLN